MLILFARAIITSTTHGSSVLVLVIETQFLANQRPYLGLFSNKKYTQTAVINMTMKCIAGKQKVYLFTFLYV